MITVKEDKSGPTLIEPKTITIDDATEATKIKGRINGFGKLTITFDGKPFVNEVKIGNDGKLEMNIPKQQVKV